MIQGKSYKIPGEDDESIMYFCKILPKIIEKDGRENLKIREFI